MKTIQRLAAVLIVALAAVSTVEAGGWGRSYYKSYTSTGWHQHYGLWYWWNGYSWSAPHTYVNGVYSLYQYATAPAYSKDWKDRLVEAAKAQDDHRAYLEALGALFPNANATSASAYAQSDNGYAYSTATIAELYGKTDINTLFNQATRLAESAQELGASATAGHLSAVKEQGTAVARVSEILARGQVAAEMLRATEPQASARVETYRNGQGVPDGARALQVAPNLIAVHCASCHGNNEKNKTGFDVTNITPEWANAAIDQIGDRKMPKNNKAMPSAVRFEIIAELRQYAKKSNPVPKEGE